MLDDDTITPERRAQLAAQSAAWRATHPRRYWLATILTIILLLVVSIGAVGLQWFYDFPLR
jgi:CHASE2 domain-containing sensor protein